MKDVSDVLKKFADDIADRIVRRTVAELKKTKDTLSGDNSPLTNAWEEICAQVQVESSYFWESYEGMAWSVISHHVSKLKHHELLAIWFQTDEGKEWGGSPINEIPVISRDHFEQIRDAEREECRRNKYRVEDDDPPLCTEDVERYIQLRFYDKAESYTNKRIERFMERY